MNADARQGEESGVEQGLDRLESVKLIFVLAGRVGQKGAVGQAGQQRAEAEQD